MGSGGEQAPKLDKATHLQRPKAEHKLPVLLWPPNLIGYVRVLTLAAAMREPSAANSYCIIMVIISLVLDYFDGPCARRLHMCSQFGDLLDHVTDHITMMWLVWVAASTTMWGQVNIAISIAHNGGALLYMLYHGFYFKHTDRPNIITKSIEANNYWNFLSMLYCSNTFMVPLAKLSFSETHGMDIPNATTPVLDALDMIGAAVTAAYTLGIWAQVIPQRA